MAEREGQKSYAMIPSIVERDIEEGLLSFINREFPISTPGFMTDRKEDKTIVDAFVDDRENLVKGPWLEIRRPFRKSEVETKEVLPLLAGDVYQIGNDFTPYKHQMAAFERLKAPEPKSTIVATGTGSGKTECFLYPILDYILHCNEEHDEKKRKGIKAIIIYPMNALASDQAKRLTKLCFEINRNAKASGLKGMLPTVGLYTGAPGVESRRMSDDGGNYVCITDRKVLRQNPPDILLTNYKMLDYLLLRDEDRSLWQATTADTLRYLVVDELHTFDGAQGTDLACLVRRLRSFLNLGKSLACVGTSATLGGDNGIADLQKYASEIFNADFSDPASIIQEDRLSAQEYFDSFGERRTVGRWPDAAAVSALRALPQDASVEDYVSTALLCWFPQERFLSPVSPSYLEDTARQLPELLPHLDAFQRLMSREETIIHVRDLALEWHKVIASLAKVSVDDVVLVIRSLVALVSLARLVGKNDRLLPFLNVRMQLWIRELSNMVATVSRHPRLLPNADKKDEDELTLPILTCRDCNATAWGAVTEVDRKVSSSHHKFYRAWFDKSDTVRLIYPIEEDDYEDAIKKHPRHLFTFCQNDKSIFWLDPSTSREAAYHKACPICGADHGHLVVWIPDTVKDYTNEAGAGAKRSDNCPCCGSVNSMRLFGARAVTLASAMVGHLNSSSANLDPKLIAFSDSVQDAAHRAGFMQARGYTYTIRQAVAGLIRDNNRATSRRSSDPAKDPMSLFNILSDLSDYWKERIGRRSELTGNHADDIALARFVTTFTPSDMMWRRPWLKFRAASSGMPENRSASDRSTPHQQTAPVLCDDPHAFFEDLFSGKTGKNGKTPRDEWNDFSHDVAARLRWEAFIELTLRAHAGRTLELGGIAALEPRSDLVQKAAASLQPILDQQVGGCRGITREETESFITGFLMHQKSRGAFDLTGIPGLEDFMSFVKTGNDYLYFNRSRVLPTYGKNFRPPAPLVMRMPSSLNRKSSGFFDAVLTSGRHENWYETWFAASAAYNKDDVLAAVDEAYARLFDVLTKTGLMNVVYMTTTDATPVYLLNPSAWTIARKLEKAVCAHCGRWTLISPEDARLWRQMPCLSKSCGGREHFIKDVEESSGLYLGTPARTTAREHTGNVESTERGLIEHSFSKGHEPWDVNLLSATPTLEMGIDIGDLSTVLQASMPPQQANYLQRIGRAGRRDGNALAMTICGNNPHAQYFWTDPDKMLAGSVPAPGVFLHAMAVIDRQLLAHALTDWMSSIVNASIPQKISSVLTNCNQDQYTPDRFPRGFFDYVRNHTDHILNEFCKAFVRPETGESIFCTAEKERLRASLVGGSLVPSIEDRIMGKLSTLTSELEKAQRSAKQLARDVQDLKKKGARDEATESEIEEKQALEEAWKDLINREYVNKETLQVLTDEGLLPNYAFPEEGIKLDGIITRIRTRSTDRQDPVKKDDSKRNVYKRLKFQRAASSGLLEIAPNNTFFVDEYVMHIDQVQLENEKTEKWRFCPSCQHAILENDTTVSSACPECGDPQWRSNGQERNALKVKTVYAWADLREDRIVDNIEERRPLQQQKISLSSISSTAERHVFANKSIPGGFRFEYISAVTLRDFNFGMPEEVESEFRIAQTKINGNGFSVCRGCGRLRNDENTKRNVRPEQHEASCPFVDSPDADDIWINGLILYREFTSEAVRIKVPLTNDESPETTMHSLAAALHLGLRRYFHGSVDHLRIVPMVEHKFDHIARRYILIHDTVPGGTGYLKELLSDKDNLFTLLQTAYKAITECGCGSEDGCYQCVYQHRDSSTRPFISKSAAIRVLGLILAQQDSVARTSSADDDDLWPGESELERNFINSLRNSQPFVKTAVERTVAGRKDFLIEMQSGRQWQMVMQEDFKNVFHPSRPDFVFRPAHASERTPALTMAVFLDGWQFHAPTVQEDLVKRQSLINAGYRVWTLGWYDLPCSLEDENRPDVPNLLSRNSAPGYEILRQKLPLPSEADLRARWSTDRNNFDRLLLWLNDPDQATKDACALDLLSRGYFGTGTVEKLDSAAPVTSILKQGGAQMDVKKDSSVLPGAWSLVRNFSYILGANPEFYTEHKEMPTNSPQAQSLMQFWAIANIMQLAQPIALLPVADPTNASEDLLAQQPWSAAIEYIKDNHAPQRMFGLFTGMPPADHSTVGSEPSGNAWDDIDPDDLPDETLVELVDKLKILDLPVPEIGCEYEDPVTHEVGELVFELYWPEQKVAVAWLEGEAETNLNGIRVFPFGVDPERLSQAVKATGSNSNSNN